MERRLAAILSADVKSYSRLMGEDEAATMRTLTAYREVLATLTPQHRGRVGEEYRQAGAGVLGRAGGRAGGR